MKLFFDTETTGIRKNGFIPRVVQIGALLTDDAGKTISELNVLLQPEGFETVPVEASNVHGFTTEMVKAYGVDRVAALDVFFDLCKTADTIIAHNISYDLDLLGIEIAYYRDHHEYAFPAASKWQEILSTREKFCTMEATINLVKLPMSSQQAWYVEKHGIDQKYKQPKLIESYKHMFGKEFDGAHDAMVDVRACAEVFFALQVVLQDELPF